MNFADAVRSCFNKFATFSGRAPRSEFWYFALFQFLGSIVFGIIDSFFLFGMGSDFGPLESLFGLIVVIPSISVAVRRLHDTDRSGWWWWLVLIPIIGWIILLFWYCTPGTAGQNQFGNDPLGGSRSDGDVGFTHKSSIPNVSNKD